MSNTSATGGVLTQISGPTEGQTLRRFLQSMIKDVTGIAGDLVRPSWQPDPPKQPNIDINWIAFGITDRSHDDNPYTEEKADGSASTMIRHEEMEILCSFYGPDCLDYTGRLREGMYLAQNRASLFSAGMGLVGFSETTHVPELINERWFDRADITMTIRREIRREYAILSFLGVDGVIRANRATETLSINWSA